MSKEKSIRTIKFNDTDRAVFDVLKAADHPLTFNEINEAVIASGREAIKIAHATSAVKKGLVRKSGEVEVKRPSNHKVTVYAFAGAEPNLDPKSGKEFNYTDGEKSILSALANSNHEGNFTLAQLSEIVGRKLTSGNINGLVRKGNLEKLDEKAEVTSISKGKVGVYTVAVDVFPEEPVPTIAVEGK